MGRWRDRSVVLLEILVVAGAYFGAARLAFAIGTTRPGIAVVWPSAGIGIAGTVLLGRRVLPGVLLGALAATLVAGDSLLPSLIATVGDGVEAGLAFELLRRAGFEPGMRRVNDVIAYVALGAVLSTAASAVVGGLSVWAGGVTSLHHLATIWRGWWLGDLTGAVVVGSFILVASRVDRAALISWRAARILGLACAIGALSYLMLHGRGSLPYLTLPLLFLLAFIYRQPGATVGTLLIATAAVILTAHGHGPFLGGGLAQSLTRAETFMAVGGVTALLAAAALSERRSAQQALIRLAESESALVEAQHLASVGSFEFDLLTDEAIWSEEMFNIAGYDRTQMPRTWTAWRDSVVAEDLDKLDAFTRELYEQSGDGSIVHRLIRPDGQVRWVELRLRFVKDATERVVGRPVRVLGTVHDITAEVIAEQNAQALFEHAPYAILVLDSAGQILRSNAHAAALFKLGPEDIDGRPVEAIIHSPEDDEAGSWYLMVADDGSLPEMELLARRGDDTEFPVEISLARLPALAGNNTMVAVRDVTRLREQTQTLQFQARHDVLTGLPNRMMFTEQLERALSRARRSGRPLAVVFADLDDFKLVNDTRGHEIGDLLLAELAVRLGRAVRQGDIVARFSGDEFVALCEDVGDQVAALEVAQRLADTVAKPFSLEGEDHSLTLSAGLVIVSDPGELTAAAVLRDADAAMYAAKAAGKGRVSVFNPDDRPRKLRDVTLASALSDALANQELVLYFQPGFALDSSRLAGFDALIRWRHPSRGMLMPADFLPVAESTGQITQIGAWVLDQACRQALAWRERFGGPRLPVSVNVSAHELTAGDYLQTLERVLGQTGMDPGLLALEVNERTLLRDLVAISEQVRRIRELGVAVLVDGFGLGQSSVAALRGLGVGALKLDRAQIRALGGDAPDSTIVAAAVGVARELGIAAIAEGVESWAALTRLRHLGCDFAIGYLFFRPVVAGELDTLIAADRERDDAPTVSFTDFTGHDA